MAAALRTRITRLSGIDNLSITQGNHNLKFGVEFRPITLYNDQLGGTTYTFNDAASFLANKPSSIAFNGDLSALSPFTGLSGNAKLAADLLHRLRTGRMANPAELHHELRPAIRILLASCGSVGTRTFYSICQAATSSRKYTADWYNSSTKNFGPRLGFTWSPRHPMAKRYSASGAGYYYGPGQTEDQLTAGSQRSHRYDDQLRVLCSLPVRISPAVLRELQHQQSDAGLSAARLRPRLQIPERVLSYTFSVQQELPGNFVTSRLVTWAARDANLFLRSITNLITDVACKSQPPARQSRSVNSAIALPKSITRRAAGPITTTLSSSTLTDATLKV